MINLLAISLTAGISNRLREGDELLVRELQGFPELRTIDRSSKHGSEAFGGAEQIYVLSDKAGINAAVETSLFGTSCARHGRHRQG